MKKILLSLFIIAAIAAPVTTATYAYFTSQGEVLGNTVALGTLKLVADPNTPGNAVPFAFTNMKPGDGEKNEDAFYYRVNLRNDGTMNLKYRVRLEGPDSETRNALFDTLRVKVGEYSSGPSKVLGTELKLSDLEEGILVDSNVKPTASDSRVRTVWFRFYLPHTAGNSVQGQSTKFDIYFDATQPENPAWTE